MKTKHTVLTGIALTLGIAAAGSWWALGPFRYSPMEILGEYDEIQLIRSLFPVRIIDPSWIHVAKDDLDMIWCFAEFKARAGVSLIVWLAALIGFFVWVRHTRSAINSVQPTAGRSAPSGG